MSGFLDLTDEEGTDVERSVRSGSVPSARAQDHAGHDDVAVVELPLSTLITPQSAMRGYRPPLPITPEAVAVRRLLAVLERRRVSRRHGPTASDEDEEDYVYINVDAFDVYTEHDRLCALHHLNTKMKHSVMYLDGILSVDGDDDDDDDGDTPTQCYVRRVPFDKLPVDHYGAAHDTVRGHISVLSRQNEKLGRAVYYRLGTPSLGYARFYTPFLWVADLAKHVVDFCEARADAVDVRLAHFRAGFDRWLRATHAASAAVAAWRAAYGRSDFRPAVVAFGAYVRRELVGLNGPDVLALGLLRELDCRYYETEAAAETPATTTSPPPTVVTPYMYAQFRRLAIGDYLRPVAGRHAPATVDGALVLPQGRAVFRTGAARGEAARTVGPGAVVSTAMDGAGSGSKWWAEAEKAAFWFAVVHRVTGPARPGGPRTLHVAWLYRPEHTACGQMHYPWARELFLSDHCSCGDGSGDDQILETDVVGVHAVDWFGGPDTTADFFVRQTYLHRQRVWVQLRPEHLFCAASQAEARDSVFARQGFLPRGSIVTKQTRGLTPPLRPGDTVLAVLAAGDAFSEPCVVEAVEEDDDDDTIRLRRLLRRHRVDPAARDAAVNEVVYSTQHVTVPASRVVGRCLVRVFRPGAPIPAPYSRGGCGNAFFVVDDGPPPAGLRQGFDPAAPCPKLRALDLFCGCGNLGRGLEEAGVVEARWANDIWPAAMHTYMANAPTAGDGDTPAVVPFVGSADVLLERAIRGQHGPAVPAPGQVDFVSGGSPCQGFSMATLDRDAPKQFKNRSMVVSFASFIDLYRPRYGLLENVPSMVVAQQRRGTGPGPSAAREDIFGQLVCALLGLGYQVRTLLGNAWAHGAPQQRQRVFLVFAAPGVALPASPLPSHAAPPGLHCIRAVGRLSNSERIAGDDPADAAADPVPAFPFVSAAAATADLAAAPSTAIGDGLVGICVRQPDHRLAVDVSDRLRRQIVAIPTRPRGMGLARAARDPRWRAAHADLFSAAQLATATTASSSSSSSSASSSASSRAFARAHPGLLFRTVRTACQVADARSAGDLHWQDQRPLSILEVRRAQGLPDDELLLHVLPADPWKLVGNAVARPMALALGLVLREAWLGTLTDEHGGGSAAVSAAVSVPLSAESPDPLALSVPPSAASSRTASPAPATADTSPPRSTTTTTTTTVTTTLTTLLRTTTQTTQTTPTRPEKVVSPPPPPHTPAAAATKRPSASATEAVGLVALSKRARRASDGAVVEQEALVVVEQREVIVLD